MRIITSLLIITLFIAGCKVKNELPAGIMKPPEMQAVFWDYLRAEVYTNTFISTDSSRDALIENLKLQDKIFQLHHTDRASYYRSLSYYSNRKELMSALIDSMTAKHKREKVKRKPEAVFNK